MEKSSTFKFLKYWLPVLLWAGFIFYLSGVPNLNSGLAVFWDVFARKLAHAGIFGFLFLLIWRALYFGQKVNFKKALLWSLILAVGYAFSDEAHQYFVPERQARLLDVGFDSLGIFLVAFCLIYFKNKKRRGLDSRTL
jgi:VanZ family protein